MEIVEKGVVKRGLDTTKFYLRINFNDKTNFLFGDSVNFFSIQEKYKFIVASIKEIVIPDVITRDFITDEVVDYTSIPQNTKSE